MATKPDPNPALGAKADAHLQSIEKQLMELIRDKIASMGWNQHSAAKALHTHQPKVSNITRANNPINPMSLEKLIKCAYRIGIEVQVVATPLYRSDAYPPLPSASDDEMVDLDAEVEVAEAS